MINVENTIFDKISKALQAQFAGICVTGEYVNTPAKFPYVSVVEQDNYQTEANMDTSDTEAFATLMYEVNVYSNKAGGKKQQCREIMDFIDKTLYILNFRRISMTPVPNMADASIYRLVARYRVETDGTSFYRQ